MVECFLGKMNGNVNFAKKTFGKLAGWVLLAQLLLLILRVRGAADR